MTLNNIKIKLWPILILLALIVSLFVGIYLSQQPQDIRERATGEDTPTPTPTTPSDPCEITFTVNTPTPTPTGTLSPTPTPTSTSTPTPTPTGTLAPTLTPTLTPTTTPTSAPDNTPAPTTPPSSIVEGPTPTRIILPVVGVDFPAKMLTIVGSIITLLGFLILL